MPAHGDNRTIWFEYRHVGTRIKAVPVGVHGWLVTLGIAVLFGTAIFALVFASHIGGMLVAIPGILLISVGGTMLLSRIVVARGRQRP